MYDRDLVVDCCLSFGSSEAEAVAYIKGARGVANMELTWS